MAIRAAKAGGADALQALKRKARLAEALREAEGGQALAMALRALRLEDLPDVAVRLFKDAEESVELDASVYAELLYAHEAREEWLQVAEVFDQMPKRNVKPDLICYNSMLRACRQSRSRLRVAAVLKDMRDAGLTPDLASYTAAMAAIPSKAHCGVILSIFKTMQDRNVRPDGACYSRVIRACACASQWEQGLELFDEMRSRGFRVDEDTAWFALRSCALARQAGLMAKKFREAEDDMTISLSDLHYDVAISASERERNWPEVLALAARMGARGVSPHQITSNSVLRACVELGRWDVALKLFKTMRSDGSVLDSIAYSTVLRALAAAQQWDELVELYEALRAPTASTSDKALLAGIGGEAGGAGWGAELAAELSMPMVAALSEVGRGEEALALYREAELRGWLQLWRRKRSGAGPALLDARRLPPQVVSVAVRAELQDAALEASPGGGKPGRQAGEDRGQLRRPGLAGLATEGPRDIIIVVAAGALGATGLDLEADEPDPGAAAALAAIQDALGMEAKLEFAPEPLACIRVPGTELQALLMKREKKPV